LTGWTRAPVLGALFEESAEAGQKRLKGLQELFELRASALRGLEVGRYQQAAELMHGVGRGKKELDSSESSTLEPVLSMERGTDPANASMSFKKLRLRRELDSELQPLSEGEDSIRMETGPVLADIADDSEGGRDQRALIQSGRNDTPRSYTRKDALLRRR
jgi:hypothetical protein